MYQRRNLGTEDKSFYNAATTSYAADVDVWDGGVGGDLVVNYTDAISLGEGA